MTTTHPAIQNFLGKAIPTFCYEIYRKDNQIYGHKIDWKHPSQVRRDYPICYDFAGKTRTIICVSNDPTITREQALSFARSVAENTIRVYTVDLTHVNPTAK